MIREVRDICDTFASRGLPNFPYSIPFTFWEHTHGTAGSLL